MTLVETTFAGEGCVFQGATHDACAVFGVAAVAAPVLAAAKAGALLDGVFSGSGGGQGEGGRGREEEGDELHCVQRGCANLRMWFVESDD